MSQENKEYRQLSLFDSSINYTARQTKQKPIKKINSYFDGQEYRGYSVKTFLVRENTEKYNPVKIEGSDDVYKMFKKLANLDHERFYTIIVDGSNNVSAVHLVFQGTLNQCLVHPREVFKTALLCCGAGIIILHNHPSGKPEPSKEDFDITKRLLEASKIMGIEILDHVIIGYKEHFSFQKKGLLKNL